MSGPQNALKSNFSVDVIRPDDMLILRLHFGNLALVPAQGSQPARLVKVETGQAARISLVFPPQSFGEASFFDPGQVKPGAGDPDAASSAEPLLQPAPMRISEPSWLVFQVPENLIPIAYSLQAVLAAVQSSQLVVWEGQVVELPDNWNKSVASPIASFFTSIEAPYHLKLSPQGAARWRYALQPAHPEGRKELWHARLIPAPGSSGMSGRFIAVTDPDSPANTPPASGERPFRMSLNPRDRWDLWKLTMPPGGQPFSIDQLMLSALGAWLKADGAWSATAQTSLTEWRHELSMGRDQYVRVVRDGYLLPLGHKASLVKITERKFQQGNQGLAAYLRTRVFIIVRERTRSYADHTFPFKEATLLTRVTPNLARPEDSDVPNGMGQDAFWPRVQVTSDSAVDFGFQVTALDQDGRKIDFKLPLFYVDAVISKNSEKMAPILSAYNSSQRRVVTLAGQALAYAPHKKAGDTSDTTFETQTLKLTAATRSGEPAFKPQTDAAAVRIPALSQFTGQSPLVEVTWFPAYQQSGPGSFNAANNKGEVIFKTGSSPALKFDKEKAGGLVSPDMSIYGLSRSFGPVGSSSLDEFAQGTFDPAKVFGAGLTILGQVKLLDLLPTIQFDAGSRKGRAPSLTTLTQGNEVLTIYEWVVPGSELNIIKDGDEELLKFKSDGQLKLYSEVRRPLSGGEAVYSVTGELSRFSVVLLPSLKLVRLNFKRIYFHAENGRKVDVSVDMMNEGGDQPYTFAGPLEFVNTLSRVIPADGFSDPPSLAIDANGLSLGYSIGLPSVGVGAFTLQNISLGAGFFLPLLNGSLNLHLAFCERHQPFILTVLGLGGGGFVGLDLGLQGITLVELSLEFGASVALNLGVASGAVTVMGGVYLNLDGVFSAYFRILGELSVLGIITVTCEFFLALTYETKDSGGAHAGKLWGVASLTVKVKIAFFSKKVSISVEREFAGSDPLLQDGVSQADWDAYCDAFA